MDKQLLHRVLYLYCKQIQIEIDADMGLLASTLISSSLLHYATS